MTGRIVLGLGKAVLLLAPVAAYMVYRDRGTVDALLQSLVPHREPLPLTLVAFIGACATFIVGAGIAMLGQSLLRDEERIQLLDHHKPETSYDLIRLCSLGLVSANARGHSITQVNVLLKDLSARSFNITIEPGTTFRSNGNHQSMAAVERTYHHLEASASLQVPLRVACINADRPIPSEENGFAAVEAGSPQVAKFLAAASDAPPMVVQAGVWAITDNLTADQIRSRLRTQSEYGEREAISEGDVEAAAGILDSLNIETQLQPPRRRG